MSKFNFLNVFTQARAIEMVANNLDCVDIVDDLALIVANDQTVWVCKLNGVSLNDATLIQRVL